MTISNRPLLAPGVALIAAGAVALGPAIVAPSALTPAQPTVAIPAVQIRDIQLAGVGRAIYDGVVAPAIDAVDNAIENVVKIVPIVGPPIADQIGFAFDLATGLIEPTVYYLSTLWSSIFKDPWAIPQWTGIYVWSVANAPLNFVASELGLIGISVDIPDPYPPFPANDFPVYDLITGRRAPAPAATAQAPRAAATARATSRSSAASRGSVKAVGTKAAGARKAAKPARAAR